MTDHPDFDGGMERLERLLAQVEETVPGASLENVRELVRALLDVHRSGLVALFDELRGRVEPRILASLAARAPVATLLLLHDLHPVGLEDRVREAIAIAHRGTATEATAELGRVAEGRAEVRIRGGTPAARSLLARAVERTVTERAPDVVLSIEGAAAIDPSLVPAERLLPRTRSAAE